MVEEVAKREARLIGANNPVGASLFGVSAATLHIVCRDAAPVHLVVESDNVKNGTGVVDAARPSHWELIQRKPRGERVDF